MKIVVFSDVHGHKELIEKIISYNPDADYFISLGDTELPLDYLLDLDIIPIKGNYPRDAGFVYEREFSVLDTKFFLTHGHKYKVQRGLHKLLSKAMLEHANVVMYGHTHIAKVERVNGIYFINPGSAYRSRSNIEESYIVLNIEKDKDIKYQFKAVATNMNLDI